MAVCRELLERQPREVQIHSLRLEESEKARAELAAEAGETALTVSAGDLFDLVGERSRRERIAAQLGPLDEGGLPDFLLYRLLAESRPEIVVDCVNTAT